MYLFSGKTSHATGHVWRSMDYFQRLVLSLSQAFLRMTSKSLGFTVRLLPAEFCCDVMISRKASLIRDLTLLCLTLFPPKLICLDLSKNQNL